ncbi:MAG: cytochrome c maturation protein CcmE, partial [Bacteroidota bacterium]
GIVIVVFIIFGAYSFLESTVEYTDLQGAMKTGKKVQMKGYWVRDKDAHFDAKENQFSFYMRDENNNETKVVLEGAKPNNFEIATSIVVKGRYQNGHFHATDVLTKCPSKYEGQAEDVKKTI